MPPVVIENPILNSAFAEPTRHFRFDEAGITNDIVDKRRTSSASRRSQDGDWVGQNGG